jgi:hypothetical protein
MLCPAIYMCAHLSPSVKCTSFTDTTYWQLQFPLILSSPLNGLKCYFVCKTLTGTDNRSFNVSITSLPFFSPSFFSGPFYLPVVSSLLSLHFPLYIKIGSVDISSEGIWWQCTTKRALTQTVHQRDLLSIILDTVWYDILLLSSSYSLHTYAKSTFRSGKEGNTVPKCGGSTVWICMYGRSTQSNNHINELKYV